MSLILNFLEDSIRLVLNETGLPGPTGSVTLHASRHNAGGADALAIDASAATGSLRTLGTGALQAAAGNDSRLSDARTPTSHAHATTDITGSTETGRSLITAASAAAAAPIILPDNTLLAFPGIIKIKEYAVADLPAPASVGKATAFCTDCLSPTGLAGTPGFGGPVYSDGTKWRLFNGLEATTDLLTYFRSYNLTQGSNSIETPADYAVLGVPLTQGRQFHSGSSSGTGALSTAALSGPSTKYPIASRMTAGTTATGYAKLYPIQSGSWGGALVSSYYTADVYMLALSAAADEFHFSIGFSADGSSTNPNANFNGLIYDRGNAHGHNGANTETWWKLARASSSNSVATDSAVAVGTSGSSLQRLEVFINSNGMRCFVNGTEVGTVSAGLNPLYWPIVQIVNTSYTSSQKIAYFGRHCSVSRRATIYT